jgi:hypothetical protein
MQESALIVARIWIVWSLILTIRVGIKLRTVFRFRDHLLRHYRGCKRYKQTAAAPKSANVFTMVFHVVGGAARRFAVPPLQPRLGLRPICRRYFEAWGVIMMPSHEIGVQGRELCSDRRSTCDCSRGAASRYLVGSSPRLTHSTAHRAIACGVSCHSPRRISCGVC